MQVLLPDSAWLWPAQHTEGKSTARLTYLYHVAHVQLWAFTCTKGSPMLWSQLTFLLHTTMEEGGAAPHHFWWSPSSASAKNCMCTTGNPA